MNVLKRASWEHKDGDVTQLQMEVPEGRRYYLKFLGRIEVEVDAGEYIRAFNASFQWAKGSDGDDAMLPTMSFSSSMTEGWFVDPAKEEVLADGDRA